MREPLSILSKLKLPSLFAQPLLSSAQHPAWGVASAPPQPRCYHQEAETASHYYEKTSASHYYEKTSASCSGWIPWSRSCLSPGPAGCHGTPRLQLSQSCYCCFEFCSGLCNYERRSVSSSPVLVAFLFTYTSKLGLYLYEQKQNTRLCIRKMAL